MSNNPAHHPSDKSQNDPGKQAAELNSKLSLIDSIRQSATAQKSQLVTQGTEQQHEESPTHKLVTQRHTQTQAAKSADGAEKSEGDTEKPAAPASRATTTQIEILDATTACSRSQQQCQELSPATLQAKLANLDFLLIDADQEAARIKAAIGDPSNSASRDPQQFDLNLPQIELGSLRRQVQGS